VHVVSEAFASMPLIARHRAVNEVRWLLLLPMLLSLGSALLILYTGVKQTLAEELRSGVHALSMVTETPEQYVRNGGTVPDSPACLGGSKHDKQR
jgi:BolA family transcriptional regulator, general stress-responsive regulator